MVDFGSLEFCKVDKSVEPHSEKRNKRQRIIDAIQNLLNEVIETHLSLR